MSSVPDPDPKDQYVFGLPDPHLDQLFISTDPDAGPAPDPSLFLENVARTEIMVAK